MSDFSLNLEEALISSFPGANEFFLDRSPFFFFLMFPSLEGTLDPKARLNLEPPRSSLSPSSSESKPLSSILLGARDDTKPHDGCSKAGLCDRDPRALFCARSSRSAPNP